LLDLKVPYFLDQIKQLLINY